MTDFPTALKSLTEGLPVKRSIWKDIRQVRLVNPADREGIDGPEEQHVLQKGRKILQGTDAFDSPEEATEALKGIKKAHKDLWGARKKHVSAVEGLTPAEVAAIPESKKVPAPRLSESYYDDVEIAKRPSSRNNRLNVPYLTALRQDGTIEPYQLTPMDVLAGDWGVA